VIRKEQKSSLPQKIGQKIVWIVNFLLFIALAYAALFNNTMLIKILGKYCFTVHVFLS
jgi:hypothetical protein